MCGRPLPRYVPPVDSAALGRWPRWADPVIAAAVAAAALAELARRPGTPADHLALAVGMALALTWRRRAPVAVLLAVHALLLAHQAAGYPADGLYLALALFLAYYTVGAHSDLRRSLAALLGGLALMATEVALEGLPIGEFLFPAIIATTVWAAGAGMRARIALAVEAETRARRAEDEQQRAAATAVADERARIARELHDVVAHSVSIMVMQAGALRRMLPPDRAREAGLAGTVERTGREALVELRRMLRLLREDGAEAPLAPQPGLDRIEDLVHRTEAAGVPVRLVVEEPRAPLPPGLDLCAYRIVQESLTNVIKHGGRATASVAVRFPPGWVDVEIVDDGDTSTGSGAGDTARGEQAGRDGDAAQGGPEPRGGHGLVGMRERVVVFGGQLTAGPAAAGGFSVRARLPLERG